jgi:hypothetical protein
MLTSDDQHLADIDLTMWRYGVLSGVVIDDAGEPAIDFQVRAVRRRIIAGAPKLEFAGTARTNDLGEFRLAGLIPGDYTVFAPAEISSGPLSMGGRPNEWLQTMTAVGTAPMNYDREAGANLTLADGRTAIASAAPIADAPGASAWLAAPPTFLGGGMTPGSSFVHLDSGQERSGLSLAIRRVATQQISGTLTVPGGSAANHALHLLPAETAAYPLFEVATAVADANGSFTFFGVPAGNYVIRVVKTPLPKAGRLVVLNSVRDASFIATVFDGPRSAPLPLEDDPVLFADQAVSVGAQPVRNVVVSLRAGVRISGRAEFQGSAPRPSDDAWPSVMIQIEAANGYSARNMPYGRFAADGSFRTTSLVPGTYVIHPSAPAGWSLKSVNAGGRDVTERPIDVSSDLTDLVITFTDTPLRLQGTVTSSGALDAASVLLFPSDREAWSNAGASSRRMSLARVSPAGAFIFSNVLPGAYFVVAVSETQTADWQDPAVLSKLAALATPVELSSGAAPSLNLTVKAIR